MLNTHVVRTGHTEKSLESHFSIFKCIYKFDYVSATPCSKYIQSASTKNNCWCDAFSVSCVKCLLRYWKNLPETSCLGHMTAANSHGTFLLSFIAPSQDLPKFKNTFCQEHVHFFFSVCKPHPGKPSKNTYTPLLNKTDFFFVQFDL